jgi:plastocyanin
MPPTPTPAPTAIPEIRKSDIVDFALESFTVSVGTTVTWTNRGGAPHTTTAGTPDQPTGQWDSDTLRRGDTFSFTFTQPGTFPYFCRIHPSIMRGTITVK